ncbi:hypothetical protein [Shewanella algae]|uniref:hypothetical protein n=1 Tax=Shewanella algae TaxID=38313 RepID=UPI001C7E79B1|nr:hypothetical protein [Shewanella algae]
METAHARLAARDIRTKLNYIQLLIEALECWAGRPTWFSPHPSDQQNFRKAVSNVKKLSFTPSTEDIYAAILHHVQDAPVMLGTPSNIESEAMKFAKKIAVKL